jgi:hypothetical protein
VGALCALAALAALSVMASGLPEQFKPMFAVIAGLYGLAMARRETLRRPVSLDLAGATLVLREQGPLLRLRACTPGGQRWSRTWWPDTLSTPDRRRLRLAASVSPRSGIHLPSMAA